MNFGSTLVATVLALGLLLVFLSVIPSPACAAVHVPKAPINLAATAGNAQISLTWSPPPSDGGATIDYYVVYQDGNDIAHPSITNYIATGLTNGQPYTYKVRAHNSVGLGSSSATVNAVPRTVPDAPSNLRTVPGNSLIALSWSPPTSDGGARIDYYVVYRDGLDVAHPIITSYDDTGLLNGQSYGYQVRAHNVAGLGDASETIIAAPNSVPGIPGDLRTTPGDQFVDLAWSAPSYVGPGTIIYHLFRDGAPIWSGFGMSYHDAPLTKGVQYLYNVAAENSIGWGQNCTSVTATPFGVPDPPWGLTAMTGNAQITLSWTVVNYSGPGTLTYHLLRDGAEVWSGSTASHEDIGLVNGQTYEYKVAASNSVGWSINSSSVSVMPQGPPTAPKGLEAQAGNEAVELDWTAPSYIGPGTLTYHLFRDGMMIWSGASFDHRDASLAKGVQYSYKVAAENSIGWGQNSTEITASPFGVPDVPRYLNASAGDEEVLVNWTEPGYVGPGVLNFHLFRDESLIWNGVGSSFRDNEVTNAITYSYKVAASNSVGWGANSTSVEATPNPHDSVPTTPRGLTGLAGDRMVDLNWTAPIYVGPGLLTYHLFRDGITIWSGAELSYRENLLQKGVQVSYEVAASNAIGWGPNCTAIQMVPFGPPDAPRNLNTTSESGSVSLNWSAPDYFGPGTPIYHLFRDDEMIFSGPALSWKDSGLVKGEPHLYQVAANNSVGWGPNCTVVEAAAIGSPDAPRGLTAYPGDAHVDLEWAEPTYIGPGILIYHLFRNGSLIWNGTQTAFSDISLINGHTYSYNIVASNSIGWGPNCTSVQVIPLYIEPTPSPPRDLKAVTGIENITLTWVAPAFSNASAIVGYLVYSGMSPNAMLNQIPSEKLGCFLSGLEKGQTYYFRVRAQNSAGWGLNSTTISGTPYGVPDMPRSLTAIEGDARIYLNWTAPGYLGPGSMIYHLFRDGSLIWNGPALAFRDSGLLNGVTYFYKVAASNFVGWGPNCSAISGMATKLILPSPPTGLKAVEGCRMITLNWTVPSPIAPGTLAYHLFRDGVLLWSGMTTEYIDSRLDNGAMYSYKVAASTVFGWGPNCTAVKATTWIGLIGTVKDSEGTGVLGAKVELIFDSKIANSTSTNSKGDFVIYAPKGTYQVRISANGKVDHVQSVSISPELFNTVGIINLQSSNDWMPMAAGSVFIVITALMLIITWRNGRR